MEPRHTIVQISPCCCRCSTHPSGMWRRWKQWQCIGVSTQKKTASKRIEYERHITPPRPPRALASGRAGDDNDGRLCVQWCLQDTGGESATCGFRTRVRSPKRSLKREARRAAAYLSESGRGAAAHRPLQGRDRTQPQVSRFVCI